MSNWLIALVVVITWLPVGALNLRFTCWVINDPVKNQQEEPWIPWSYISLGYIGVFTSIIFLGIYFIFFCIKKIFIFSRFKDLLEKLAGYR